MLILIRYTMEHQWSLGLMSFTLVFVPILGMWSVHKYGWEHWAPFKNESHS